MTWETTEHKVKLLKGHEMCEPVLSQFLGVHSHRLLAFDLGGSSGLGSCRELSPTLLIEGLAQTSTVALT